MNTLHLKISIFIALFLTFLCSLSAQEEVDYASRFYKIEYSSDTVYSCPRVDSVEIVDIYGKVYYSGDPDKVGLSSDKTILHINKEGFWNAYDINGKTIKQSEYSFTTGSGYSERALYTDDKGENFGDCYISQKQGKYGLTDTNGNIILPFEYDEISILQNQFEERISVCVKNDKIGFADYKTGKLLTRIEYSEIQNGEYFWQNGRYIPVKNANSGLWGYLDYKGNVIVPCKYKSVNIGFGGFLGYYLEVWDGLTVQKDNDLWDILDDKGRKLFTDCQNVIHDADTNHIIFVQKDNQTYAVNELTGKIFYSIGDCQIAEDHYSYAIHGKYAVIKEKRRFGVLNILTGEIIIPCQYAYVKLLVSSRRELQYAACWSRSNIIKSGFDCDFIRLEDGEFKQSISNVGSYKSMYSHSGISLFTTESGCWRAVACDGTIVFDESDKIKKEVRIFDDYHIITEKGIFDITGKLVVQGGNYDLKCYDGSTFCILYNKYSQNIEYYVYENGFFHQVNGYDGISKYLYTQCQKKFRKQPSDVDKNIPETNTTNSNTYAFIIANEDYPSIPVPYGLNDGRSFKTYCEKTLGIPTNHITMFENATTGQFIACVEQMKRAANANNGDIDIIFYYAGHAFPDGESKTYLLPIDGDATIPATGFGLDRFYEELGQMNVNSVICFMDACFSGVTRDDNMLLAGRGVIIKPKESKPRGNMVVFTAANSTETAHQYQAKKHGMFTYYLLKKLKESKGAVTLGELDDYLNSNVKKMSFEVNNKLQTPKVLVSPAMELKWRTLKLND